MAYTDELRRALSGVNTSPEAMNQINRGGSMAQAGKIQRPGSFKYIAAQRSPLAWTPEQVDNYENQYGSIAGMSMGQNDFDRNFGDYMDTLWGEYAQNDELYNLDDMARGGVYGASIRGAAGGSEPSYQPGFWNQPSGPQAAPPPAPKTPSAPAPVAQAPAATGSGNKTTAPAPQTSPPPDLGSEGGYSNSWMSMKAKPSVEDLNARINQALYGLNTAAPQQSSPQQKPTGPNSGTVGTPTTAGPGPGQQQSGQQGARLSVHGLPNVAQAQMISDFLKQYLPGQTISSFAVGGTAPQDSEINSLIDQANNPNASPAELAAIASRLNFLIGQRVQNVQGQPDFMWDPSTNSVQPYRQAPADIIRGLTSQSTTRAVPDTDNALLRSLIERFSQGGVTPEERAAAEARIVTAIERAASTRRQQLADRYGAAGLSGGYAVDQLGDIDEQALSDRGDALTQMELSFADKDINARRTALDTILAQMGLKSQEESSLRSNALQRALAQANLAQDDEQFRQNLGLRLTDQSTNRDQMRINLILQLLSMEQYADERDRDAIRDLLGRLLVGEEVL